MATDAATRAEPEQPAQAGPPARMLLDAPASQPSLDFAPTAAGLAQIIERSEPRFAIGIFGGWGSGKTTLMEAIEARLKPETTVTVRFNAWRFEREPHILVPLLDAIREGLANWAADHADEPAKAEQARKVARRIGRVVRALVTGVSAEVGISEVVKVKYDVGKAIDALSQPAEEPEAEQPQSLYFAGFLELERAFTAFAKDGATRVVVFVDDLDRCLPPNALEVLESMKLFFDLPGFVFVVGLDEQIVDRAVRSKLRADAGPSDEADASERLKLGQEYVKKIFQVPYALPPVPSSGLDQLLESMYREAGLGAQQVDDLRARVRPFLDFIAVEGRINPREVKRFINAYTLQMLVRPGLERDTVLALQTMAFRADWGVAYSALLADSDVFKEAVRTYRGGDGTAIEDVWPSDARAPIPMDFIRFVRSHQARPLEAEHTLEPYLFSLQSTRGSNPRLIEMLGDVGRLRRLVREAGGLKVVNDESTRIATGIDEIVRRIAGEPLPAGREDSTRITGLLDQLSTEVGPLTRKPGPGQMTPDVHPDLLVRMRQIVEQLQQELTILRRTSLLPS
jgi:KAP family P-loop domain